jgi:Mrp family chromosome partitioning ATPase
MLTAGPASTTSTELLRSFRLTQILEQLHAGFDMIVFDCPPALAVAHALVVANLADATPPGAGGDVYAFSSGESRKRRAEPQWHTAAGRRRRQSRRGRT